MNSITKTKDHKINGSQTAKPFMVSAFSNIRQIKAQKNISFEDFCKIVRKGTCKQVEEYRASLNDPKKDSSELKKDIPYITPAGIFTERKDDACEVASKIMGLDIDNWSNSIERLEEFKQELLDKLGNYVLAMFISPSLNGLKLFFKVEFTADKEAYKKTYVELANYVNKTCSIPIKNADNEEGIDLGCKNISRACFFSIDENLYFNPEAQFVKLSQDEATTQENKQSLFLSDSEKFEKILRGVETKMAFVSGQRNKFVHYLACACNRYGLHKATTIHEICSRFQQSDFDNKEITTAVNSAYDKNSQEFGKYPFTSGLPINKAIAPKKKPLPKTEELDFYTVIRNRDEEVKDIKIKQYELLELLKKLGFRRYDLDNGACTYIKITNNIIKEVDIKTIEDEFFEYLDTFPDKIEGIDKKLIYEKLYKGISTYFSDKILNRLKPEKGITIQTDTKREAFFYFQNGFVKVTNEQITFYTYQELEGYIWDSQIIQRDYKSLVQDTNSSFFSQFLLKISSDKKENFQSIRSIIGYLLHSFTSGKRKAINFTDSNLSGESEGRSGKTLLAKALGKLRNYCEINGKDFKPEDKHKYQTADLSTNILNINDVRKNFSLENLYNDITEGVKVEPKGQKPFYIKPKIIICSNRPLKTESGSDRDRILEFEFSNFFNESHSPLEEFGHWFFEEWDQEEWNKFSNFMIACVQFYLQNGLIKPANTNLAKRKLIESTCPEFIDFMVSLNIEFDKEYDKKELYQEFLADLGDAKLTQRTFTNWLRLYAKYTEGFAEVNPDKDEIRIRKANHNSSFIIFRKSI